MISGAPLTITQGQVAMLHAAKSVPDVAKLALNLENVAAETYTFAAANVTDTGGIMTAATIQPVETMHAAILSFVLGAIPGAGVLHRNVERSAAQRTHRLIRNKEHS